MSADAPEMRQDAILGVLAPQGLSGPTVPAVDAVATIALHVPIGPYWGRLVCRSCKRDWRGDATTGGCTAVLLARRVIALEAALARWANPPNVGAAWPVGDA